MSEKAPRSRVRKSGCARWPATTSLIVAIAAIGWLLFTRRTIARIARSTVVASAVVRTVNSTFAASALDCPLKLIV
jgi:hypothetical protein